MARHNIPHGDAAGSQPWPSSGPESESAVWNHQPREDDSPVPDTLRPGVVPVTTPGFAQDDLNPWGDTEQQNGSAVRKPSPSPDPTSQVPQSLQPGVARKETNPFKRKPAPSRTQPQDVPASLSVPSRPPASSTTPPTASLSQMRLDDSESSANPWQPGADDRSAASHTPLSQPLLDQESTNNVWGAGPALGQSSQSTPPAIITSQKTGDSAPWADEVTRKEAMPPLPAKTAEQHELSGDRHAWDDVPSSNNGQGIASMARPQGESWNLIDHDAMPPREPSTVSRQSSWENFMDADDAPSRPAPRPPSPLSSAAPEPEIEEPPAPALPPRTNTIPQEQSQPQPQPQPLPQTQTQTQSSRPPPKSETYQIKNINWYDAQIKVTRKSPILVQNVNGPCPLVALVNALTLTTPHTSTSNLVETLRSREQVSISFLLEAVIDELMSSGRRDVNADLPDMTELYDFLTGLQTGMNVNPRFLPSPEAVTRYKRTSLGHVHPHERDGLIPGTFEETKDMTLYATFSVPLLHGWLPPRDDPVFDAFERQTPSYDDVQNLLFREEELEFKLSTTAEGLTEPEQQLYQDIITIKAWLSSTATQLTNWGLEVITKSIQPGGVAILFRNDHFATLYRHPQTQELLTLVTDAGYHKHDEVIWESLVDVRGENSDFYSGDFRVVGGSQGQQAGGASSSQGGDWHTVQSRRGGSSSQRSGSETSAQPPSQTEQEDRDLALALQLQEEEEERHRNEQATRQRQSELSEQYIEQQGRAPPQPPRPGTQGNAAHQRGNSHASIPVRGPGSATSGTRVRTTSQPQAPVRSLVPPRTHRPAEAGDGDEPPPPTYEQASQSTPYTPPTGHPSHPGAAPTAPRRASGQPPMVAGPSTPSGAAGRGRYPNMVPAGGQQPGPGGREEKCAVM